LSGDVHTGALVIAAFQADQQNKGTPVSRHRACMRRI